MQMVHTHTQIYIYIKSINGALQGFKMDFHGVARGPLVAGFFPMIISQVFQSPWSDIIFHAETVQRWFLLALLLGRATIVGGLWSGSGNRQPTLVWGGVLGMGSQNGAVGRK